MLITGIAKAKISFLFTKKYYEGNTFSIRFHVTKYRMLQSYPSDPPPIAVALSALRNLIYIPLNGLSHTAATCFQVFAVIFLSFIPDCPYTNSSCLLRDNAFSCQVVLHVDKPLFVSAELSRNARSNLVLRDPYRSSGGLLIPSSSWPYF